MPDTQSPLRSSTEKACEEIDAALFSGDEFIDAPDAVAALRAYLARWERELNSLSGS